MRAKNRAKVVLAGYYGFDNAGDEAILDSIIQTLRQQHPDIEITVLSNRPAHTRETYSVAAVNRWHYRQVVAALKGCHLFLSGGGSLLQDVTGFKSLSYYLGVISLARILGKPVFFYAQGIGPVNTLLGRLLTKIIVSQVQAITVRDKESKEDLLAMGVNKPPITITADPVLGVEITLAERLRGRELLLQTGLNPDKPILVLSLRSWHNYSEALHVALARCCDHYAAKDWQVLFLPFHPPGDLAVCQQVAALMTGNYFLPEQKYTVQEIRGILSCCRIMLGMRLHALIMAAVAGVPLAGISYDPKIERFLNQLGLKPVCAVNAGHAGLIPELERLEIAFPGEQGENICQRLPALKEQALHTARLVQEELEKIV